MKVLGISSYYHDSAAALIDDGRIIAANQEERFTRKKHEPGFPSQAIRACLKQAECQLSDVDAVVYYEKPLLKFDRLLENYFYNAPFGLKHFVQTLPTWIKQKLFLRQNLDKELKKIDSEFQSKSLFFSEHHLSHGASAFFPSPFEDAAVLTLDGVGEWATVSFGEGSGNQFEIKKEIHFPHSLGLFYSAFTAFCGFKVNSGEYKLMGLAPYGDPVFTDKILEHILFVQEDGSFSLNLDYFDFLKGESMFNVKFSELFGVEPRSGETELKAVHMNLAASVQKALEICLLNMIRQLKKESFPGKSSENLCLAGGVALNCVANSKLLKQGPFKNIWIQPAAGDAGGALGAALAYYYSTGRERRVSSTDDMGGAYLGVSYEDREIEAVLKKSGAQFTKMSEEQLLGISAKYLSQGQSLGWFQGAMEFGPRALGARSILADPRNEEMQRRLNLQIKFRESFRPFAPLVLEEDMSSWFEWKTPSPYMLFVADVAKGIRHDDEVSEGVFGIERLNHSSSSIPAVTHVDYSARLQTVGSASPGSMIRKLLVEFKKQTDCPVLVNTSFNVRGEPIVGNPKDALNCFLGTGLDALAIGSYFLKKSDQPKELLTSYHESLESD